MYVPKSRTASLFRSSCIHLMTLDSAVTQLDYCDGHLLVSTLDRSYICNTSLETFAQIGTKLRKGEFGGCFCKVNLVSNIPPTNPSMKHNHHEVEESLEENPKSNYSPSDSGKFELSDCYEVTEDKEENIQQPTDIRQPTEKSVSTIPQQGVVTRIFCARPGSRVWEADLSGKVLVTHQLKNALMVPPVDVLLIDGSYGDTEMLQGDALKLEKQLSSLKQWTKSKKGDTLELVNEKGSVPVNSSENSSVKHSPVGVAFTKMLNFYNSFLLAVSNFGLYIIDPSNSTVLLWVSEPDGILDIKVSGNTLIYKTGHGSIQNFMITTVDVAILVLHNRSLMIECARLCLQHHYIFSTSRLLCRLGIKVLSDLTSQIVDENVKRALQTLENMIGQNQDKENQSEINPKKSGITYVRNEKYNSCEIKESLHFALRLSHHAFLPASVTRWYSEPHLGYGQDLGPLAQRSAVSVETSPIHELKGNRFLLGTSSFLQDLQSGLSLGNYSSEDTLQSFSKSHSGFSSLSDGSDRKSSSPDPLYNRTSSSPTHSSGRWSQQSDKSHKSLESSQEMYEDPLFPPSDSSPELEMAARMYLDNRCQHSGNSVESQSLYSIPYAPISPSSETAAIVQDLMENAATNVVSTITLGTKSLKEKFKNVTQLKTSSEMSPLRTRKSPFSVLDILGNSSIVDCEDPFQSSTSGTDETDGFDVDIVIKTKTKKKGSRKAIGASPVMSRQSTLPEVDDIMHSSSIELPGVVRNLHELVMSTMKQITVAEDQQETTDLLTQWFEVYCSAVQHIYTNKNSPQGSDEPQDGPVSISSVDSLVSVGTSCDSLKWDSNDIGFEPSAMSADILEQLTKMFLHCLQSRVYAGGSNLRGISGFTKVDIPQHQLTPDDVKKLDALYAQLITNDCGLLHYSTLLNALDTLGQNYFLLTWIALLEKVTKDSEVVSIYPLPDIISDLDFTRSQRVSFLYKLACSGNMKHFISAAVQVQNPYVIFDVIFMLNFVLHKPNESTVPLTKYSVKHYLFLYLKEIAKDKDIRELYLAYWSWCPELQYDVLSALLSALNPSSMSCNCGMPIPCSRSIPLENLVETLLSHHILAPKNMLQLCQSSGYWKGYCILSLAYKLHAPAEIFPHVLQTCDADLIEMAMDSLDKTELSVSVKTMMMVTSTNISVIKCFKCQSIIELLSRVQEETEDLPENPIFKFRVNGEPHYEGLNLETLSDKSDENHLESLTESLDVVNTENIHSVKNPVSCKIISDVKQLWETVIIQLLRKTQTADTLQLLQSVQEEIPPGIIPQRVYSWCIMLSLVENRGPAARWALLDSLTNSCIKPYSKKVAEAIRRSEPSSTGQENISVPPTSNKEPSATFSPLGHHWGVRSQVLQGICHFCQLRLPEEALVSVGGVTVFPCSHAYHAICLAQRGYYCIICTRQESLKLRGS
ncbi:uncharacterized protein LOC135221014 [Macrobrachium nipponense]|uniref:uncharacterized protein LOC135221014 n=1 Tax=Macrobrachium nipponense TaxID=159736 RepID=UPI0030C8595B